LILVNLPIGKSTSVVRLFIVAPPPSPIARSVDPDLTLSIGKANRHDLAVNLSETKQALFCFAMFLIGIDFPMWIFKRPCSRLKANVMLPDVGSFFSHIPDKTANVSFHRSMRKIPYIWVIVHIIIHILLARESPSLITTHPGEGQRFLVDYGTGFRRDG